MAKEKLPENIEEIEKFYKEKFEKLSVNPSPKLWENIGNKIKFR